MKRLSLMFGIVMAFFITSCTELTDLLDDTSLKSFTVEEVYTENVELGTPTIIGDSVVEIPFLFGKYEFPVTFKSKIVSAESAMKVIGINPDSITFEALNEEIVFYVVAQNGKTAEWTLRLKEFPRSGSADIESFKINEYQPADAYVSLKGKVNVPDTVVNIFVPEAKFPLTIMPAIVLTDSAKFLDYTPGTAFVFENEESEHVVTVKASDGLVKRWRVKIEKGTLITAESTVPAVEQEGVMLDPNKLAVSLVSPSSDQSVLTKVAIDQKAGKIVCTVKNKTDLRTKRLNKSSGGSVQLPIDLMMTLALPSYAESIGYTSGTVLRYVEMDGVFHFYLFDRERNYAKKWELSLVEWKSSSADVTAFRLLQSTPSSIKIDINNIDINSSLGLIVLNITDGKDNFPLTLKAAIDVSPSATVSDFTNGQAIVFPSTATTYSFQVTAEDGTVKNWTIKLQFVGELNANADVESFVVTAYSSVQDKVVLDPVGKINVENKTITIDVLNWGSYFPIKLKATMAVSYKASFTSGYFTNTDELSFASIGATRQFTLMSEDGSTSNTYTIQFANLEGDKSNEADLIDFTVSNLPSGYTLDDVVIDQTNKKIALNLLTLGSSNLTFTPRLTVSPNAQVQGMTSGIPFTFGVWSGTKSFKIISESEATQNTWTVTCNYVPQLPNGTLESWSGNTPTGWANANNSFATLTTKSGGNGGGSGAQLKTSSILGNVAAGSLFLGYFKMDLNQISNPRMMTYFGMPFTARPKSITVDLKYQSAGSDKGSVVVELINYSGSGDMVYHTIGNESGVTVLSRGRLFVDTQDWTTVTVPFEALGSNLPVTHIHVAFSSSYRGDELIGSSGATMWVDNIRLNY